MDVLNHPDKIAFTYELVLTQNKNSCGIPLGVCINATFSSVLVRKFYASLTTSRNERQKPHERTDT